jgi:hypothetical protein
MVGFGISSVEPLGSATTVLVYLWQTFVSLTHTYHHCVINFTDQRSEMFMRFMGKSWMAFCPIPPYFKHFTGHYIILKQQNHKMYGIAVT